MVAAFFMVATCVTGSIPSQQNFLQILASLPHAATPFSKTKTAHVYATNFQTSFTAFSKLCPTIKQHNISEINISQWMNKNITEHDLQTAPVQFRDAAYWLATTMTGTQHKNNLLITVSKTLPDSKLLTTYLSDKRFEIADILQTDAEIQFVNRNWNKITNEAYKTRVLQRVVNITLDTLLPHKSINYPKVRWVKTGLNADEFGYYRSAANVIDINGSLDPSRYTFQFASDIVTHEAVHAFQDILITWGLNGHFKTLHDIDRYVSILYANRSKDAGAFRFNASDSQSQTGYHLMKTEAMAWGFARIGQTITHPHMTQAKLGNLVTDMYTKIDIVRPYEPVPNARLVASIPIMPDNYRAGVIPAVCLH